MDPAPPLPEHIGPYRVTGRLGRGGMGEVLRGHDDRLDRPVALKCIRPDARDPQKALQRFRREARAVARLSHPAIVQVHDWEESEGQSWLVMELVEGRTLDEVIAEGPLPPDRVLDIAHDIASGLAEAHDAGLVHRDLKASNVILSHKSRSAHGQAKILDFGLAKTVRLEDSETAEAAMPSSTLTKEGNVVGTVTAMSPEQALGKKVDPRSDLFSLGILLYEMLSGILPFKGDSAIETLTRICSAKEEPLRRLDPKIPEGVSSLVTHLLEKEPALRPSGARLVVAEIDRLRSGSWKRVSVESGTEELTKADVPLSQVVTLSAGDGVSVGAETLERIPARETKGSAFRWGAGVTVVIVAFGLWGWTSWLESTDEESAISGPVVSHPLEADLTSYELYQRGMAYLERPDRKGNIDKATTAFQKALAQDQRFAPALAGLARAYHLDYFRGSRDSQHLEQALAAAEQAVKIDEYLAVSRVILGSVYLEIGRLDDAMRELLKALEIEPSNASAWAGLGRVFEIRGDFQQAEEHYLRAGDIQPEKAEHLGMFYYRAGRYEEAIAVFLGYLQVVPDNFVVLSNLGAMYYMQGSLTEASAWFQKALLVKQDSAIYSNMGTIYFTQGLYAQSASAFQKAIENGGSNNYLLWGNLGDARRWTPGQKGMARKAYLRAIQLLNEKFSTKPQDSTLRTRIALYAAKAGDCDQFLAAIDESGDLPADDGRAWFRLAVAQEVCERRDDALAALEASLKARFSLEEIQRDPELLDLRQDLRFHELALRYPSKGR